jgi:hypothetical protein
MTIKKFRKELAEIKHQVEGQIPDENEIIYQVNTYLAEENPKFRNSIKELANYLATTPHLYESIDENESIKLKATIKPNSTEATQYQKLYNNYTRYKIEAIKNIPDEDLKKTLLEQGFI